MSRRSLRNPIRCFGQAAAIAAAFRILRQPSRPNPTRPLVKSGSAAGSGTGFGLVSAQSCLHPHQPITVLGHCGLRDDAIELSITLDSSGGDFISSELTEKRRSLIEFDDPETTVRFEDAYFPPRIKCHTGGIVSHLDRYESIF